MGGTQRDYYLLRALRIPYNEDHKQKMLSFFEEHIGDQDAKLYLGGYGNFDQFAYSCGKEYQKKHGNVELVFVRPYLDERYQKSKSDYGANIYDAIIYPELERVPYRIAIIRRNQWMVEQADLVVAYITHRFGGAYTTYRYAMQKKKSIFLLSDIPVKQLLDH